MTTAGYALLAFTSLFSVINPIGSAPIFVSMTEGKSDAERKRTARRACSAAAGMLAVFAAAGGAIFGFFGITIPAFQIAGGLLFLLMGIRTLGEEVERRPAGAAGPDPSIVPLGIPLIAGPGAISTVMVLVGQAREPLYLVALTGVIVANILATYLILRAAPVIVARIGVTGQTIIGKVMALLTAVIGVQFIINGVTTVFVEILKTVRSA